MEQDHYTRGKPTSTTNTSPNAPKKSDLMSSAKVMADAAKSAFAKDTEKIDKAKVAGAAADLLGAAKHYGKLEENNNNFGKYVGKAETYLHQYHSSHAPSPHASSTQHGGTYGNSSGASSGSGSGSGGGYGEYVKLAQGFLNKKQDHGGEGGASGGHSSGGGGAGDYIKLAQGLLNKKQGHGGEGGNGHSSSGGAEEYIKLAQGFLNKKH